MIANVVELLSGDLGVILLGIFIALVIIGIIKKLLKLAIIALLVVTLLGGSSSYISGIQENYGFALQKDNIAITISDKVLEIPKAQLKGKTAEVTFLPSENLRTQKVQILLKLSPNSPINFVIPRLAYSIMVKPVLNSADMVIQEMD